MSPGRAWRGHVDHDAGGRFAALLARSPGKAWSILELQAPYPICGADRAASYSTFFGLAAGVSPAPTGLGAAIAPISTPEVDIDVDSLAVISAWAASK